MYGFQSGGIVLDLMRIGIFILLILTCGYSARAEVFRSAPLSAGKFSLGMEPEIVLGDDTDFTFFVDGGYGFAGGYGLHMKIGFGESAFNDDEVYLGGMFDIPLVRDGKGYPGLYLSLGANSLGDVAFDQQLIIHNGFGQFTLYGGLDSALVVVTDSPGDDVTFPVEVVFGGEFAVSRPVHVLLEGGIELHDSASYISGGVKFYF